MGKGVSVSGLRTGEQERLHALGISSSRVRGSFGMVVPMHLLPIEVGKNEGHLSVLLVCGDGLGESLKFLDGASFFFLAGAQGVVVCTAHLLSQGSRFRIKLAIVVERLELSLQERDTLNVHGGERKVFLVYSYTLAHFSPPALLLRQDATSGCFRFLLGSPQHTSRSSEALVLR